MTREAKAKPKYQEVETALTEAINNVVVTPEIEGVTERLTLKELIEKTYAHQGDHRDRMLLIAASLQSLTKEITLLAMADEKIDTSDERLTAFEGMKTLFDGIRLYQHENNVGFHSEMLVQRIQDAIDEVLEDKGIASVITVPGEDARRIR